MKRIATLLVLIIAAVTAACAEDNNDEDKYENFGPTPGTETNPLLNVDFYINGVSAYYFNHPGLGNPPTFPHYLGYTAEYADGTVETDSVRLLFGENPATTFSPSAVFRESDLFFDAEKFVQGSEEYYIDEENKAIVVNQNGAEFSYNLASWVANNPERTRMLIEGIRTGEKRSGIRVNNSVPDADDMSYHSDLWIYDYPTFRGCNTSSGYQSIMSVYDENGESVVNLYMTCSVFIVNAYMKEYHTMTQPDIVRVIDWSFDYTPLGQAYGADETVRTEGTMTLGYHDYTLKYSWSALNHIYLTPK